MALLQFPLLRRGLFLKRYFFFVLVVASLPFTGYFILLAHSKTFSASAQPFGSKKYLRDSSTRQTLTSLTTRNLTGDQKNGIVNIDMWSDLCGTDVDVLRNWPHFPYLPDKRSVIEVTDFHNARVQDSVGNNGDRIFGFIHPPRSGDFKFAITSDGPSELWLSSNEDPSFSKVIARVYPPYGSASALEGKYKKYPTQVSKGIRLDFGKKYYIESLTMSQQGSGETHVTVYWTWLYASSWNSTFEVIPSKYLSSFYGDVNSESILPPHAGKPDIPHENKMNLYYFNRLPFVSKKQYIPLLPPCPYSPSFLVRKKLKRYAGVLLVKESLVFAQDDTAMFKKANSRKGQEWAAPNPLVHRNRVKSVLDKLMSALRSR